MINCIAIDDEPLALAQITRYIEKIPYLHLEATCRDAFEAIDALQKSNVDLIFVDINLPDLSGLDFVKTLTVKPLIIFTTAYSEYAIEGFKVEALDYLLKPFAFDDMLAATEKARRRLEERTTAETADESIFVKSDYRTTRLNYSDILYIEGMNEYVRIFTTGDEKPLMPLITMKRFEEVLPATSFMRVHRSYIVNLTKINEIQRQRIIFGSKYIPIGDNYRDKFQAYVNGKMIK